MVGQMGFNLAYFRALNQSKWMGKPIELLDTIGSTNTFLKDRLAGGQVQSGAVVFAEHQLAGRGRLGRRWVAPAASSLLVSVLLRPKIPLHHATWLTMIAGLAVSEAVEQVVGISLSLKWPNDLMLQNKVGAWCKTGGILLEAETAGDGLTYAIIGMGLNVNIATQELPQAVTPATSLQAATGRMIERELLLARWLMALERLLEAAELGHSPQPAWNQQLLTIGQWVTVSGAVQVEGDAVGTDDFGRLLVRDTTGIIHPIVAGDVTLRASKDNN